VASGRTLEEIAADPERVWHSDRDERKEAPEVPAAKKARMPERIAPQLATLVEEPPRGEPWLHELKYDGYRVLVHLDGGKARIVTRSILRHPTFQALREDKPPEEVVRERPKELPPEGKEAKEERMSPAKAAKAAKTTKAKTEAGSKPPVKPAPAEPPPEKPQKEATVAGVRLSNPDKVLYPSTGLTKRDLATYYDRIEAWILPYLKDRPLTLVRCPQGAQKKCFYQKHVSEQFPKSVRRVEVEESGDGAGEPYGAVASLEGLLSMVQMGVLELHVWGSRRQTLEKPDYLVFDLDPDEGLPWERVVEAAFETRELLSGLGLESFLKTTGGKGLHVALPIRPRLGWDEVKAFTRAVSERLVANAPNRYTAKLPKASRKGKVFIDYLRNGRGATSIVAYSTRAKPGAPVSTPLAWEELERGVRSDSFNLSNLPERLESLAADPWAGFFEVKQSITQAMRAAVGMG
jgi:bifunctional non-homologous end joining protein LigD